MFLRPRNPPSHPNLKAQVQGRLQHTLETDHVSHHFAARVKPLVRGFRRATIEGPVRELDSGANEESLVNVERAREYETAGGER